MLLTALVGAVLVSAAAFAPALAPSSPLAQVAEGFSGWVASGPPSPQPIWTPSAPPTNAPPTNAPPSNAPPTDSAPSPDDATGAPREPLARDDLGDNASAPPAPGSTVSGTNGTSQGPTTATAAPSAPTAPFVEYVEQLSTRTVCSRSFRIAAEVSGTAPAWVQARFDGEIWAMYSTDGVFWWAQVEVPAGGPARGMPVTVVAGTADGATSELTSTVGVTC